MGRRCTVQGCRTDTIRKTYNIPAIRKNEEAITTRRQNLWLKRLNLFGKKQSIKDVWVCDTHFLSGKPSYYMDEKNPDWAPSQNIGSINFVTKSVYERYKRRKKFQAMRVTAQTTECLLKEEVSYRICHQASAASSPSTQASSDNDVVLSKEIEAKKKITHQMPGVSKKQESDVIWMDKLPVGNTSQVCFGENIKLGKIHPSNVAQALKSNDQVAEAPRERIEKEKNGMHLEQGEKNNQELLQTTILSAPTIFDHQMVRNNRIIFISSNTTHDHDYCAKQICINGSSESVQEHRFPIDHDYCRPLPLYGPSSTVENDSNPLPILPQMEAPIHNSHEEPNIDDGKEACGESRLESTTGIHAGWDFILPDVARDENGSSCNRCSEGVSNLKLDLERKSATLEHRLNELNSLKQELELAKEHIDKLRAQLEETTHTLCSYFSQDGKSS